MWTYQIQLRCLPAISALLACSTLGFAQSQPAPAQPPTENAPSTASPLAAAARSTKEKAAHVKKVLTDEDMEATAGPLPRLKMDGAENADDVMTAIATYKSSHTPEQTESAVHIWYDRYDQMLAAAIQQNLDVKVLRDANYSNGYELCQQCQNRQMAELRGARNDQLEMAKNTNLEVRIQHAFMKVRNGLMQNGLRYDWFKVRTTNGIDTF